MPEPDPRPIGPAASSGRSHRLPEAIPIERGHAARTSPAGEPYTRTTSTASSARMPSSTAFAIQPRLKYGPMTRYARDRDRGEPGQADARKPAEPADEPMGNRAGSQRRGEHGIAERVQREQHAAEAEMDVRGGERERDDGRGQPDGHAACAEDG